MASSIPDSQLLLSEADCIACIGNGRIWPLMRLTLLLELYDRYSREPMPDATTLAAESKCYECFGPNDYTLRLMELAIARRILLALDPTANTDPQALLNEAVCYNCFGSTSVENLIELALLTRLSENAQPPQ